MGELGRSGVSAVKWSAVSTAARFVLQLAAQVVLARTLGPDVYGVFAIGTVVLTFANFVSSFGFSWSLLQRNVLHEEDVRFAFTWQVLLGLLTMAVLYLSAPALAAYFNEPRAKAVIEWLSLASLLAAAAAPSGYMMQRDLNFRAVGLIQIGSYAVGYLVVGVPMALSGWGVDALVAAWLVQAGVMMIANFAVRPHSLRPLFWYADAAHAVGTGRAVFFTNIVNWSLNNIDRIMIGRLLNAHALGLYNVAYNVATMPNTLLLGALQPAFLSAGARLQTDPERLGRAYLQMIAVVLVLVLPAFVFLSLVSSDLVRFLYGARWTGAAWVLGLLFLSIPAYVWWGLSTPVLWNTGRKNHEFLLQLPLLALGTIGFYLFAGRGLHAAAAVTALLLLGRAVVIGVAALQALHLRAAALLPHALRGLMLSALCVVTVRTAQYAVARFSMPLLSLMASGLAALAVLALLLIVRPQILGQETAGMLLRFFPQLSGVLARANDAPLSSGAGERGV